MTEQLPTAGFFKRLAAWVYDFLVAVAIAMLATVFALILQSIIVAVGWLSIPSGQDAASVLTQGVFAVLLQFPLSLRPPTLCGE